MAHRVRSNLFKLLNDLQTRTGKRYFWTDVGESLGLSGQAAKDLFTSDVTETSYIKYGTMASLLDFFNGEGLDVGIADLFAVTRTDGGDS